MEQAAKRKAYYETWIREYDSKGFFARWWMKNKACVNVKDVRRIAALSIEAHFNWMKKQPWPFGLS